MLEYVIIEPELRGGLIIRRGVWRENCPDLHSFSPPVHQNNAYRQAGLPLVLRLSYHMNCDSRICLDLRGLLVYVRWRGMRAVNRYGGAGCGMGNKKRAVCWRVQCVSLDARCQAMGGFVLASGVGNKKPPSLAVQDAIYALSTCYAFVTSPEVDGLPLSGHRRLLSPGS